VTDTTADDRAPSTDLPADASDTPRPGRRPQLRGFVELFALCGFAIAQPLLDIFGRNPAQFIFRNATNADIWWFALIVVIAPPVALWLLESIVGLVAPRARTWTHLALIALLVWALTVQLAHNLVDGIALMLVAGTAGVGAAVLRHRTQAVRMWLSFAALAPLVFLGLFLFSSETARLVFAEEPRAVEAGIGNPAPVVLVVLDELPLTAVMTSDGEVDAELLPNIAEFAGDSTWFRNTTATSSSTAHAVPSIVTGRYPKTGTAPIAADHPENLFTLLGDAYELNVTESVTRLCPETLCTRRFDDEVQRSGLYGDALKVMKVRLSWTGESGDPVGGFVEGPVEVEEVGGADGSEAKAGEDEEPFDDFELDQPKRFRALLDTSGDGPTLDYLHILLPHVPYRYVPSGVQYAEPNPDIGRIEDDWVDQSWPPKLGRQRLQLQLGYVDALLGELFDSLRDQGRYDESLVIITADHGINFRPGRPIRGIEGQNLTDEDLAQLAWVPLFVKTPGQTDGEVSDANVETIDIVPTIADVLDVELPWPVDGRSAFESGRDNTKAYRPSDVTPFDVAALDPIELDSSKLWPLVLAAGTDSALPALGSPQRYWQAGPRPELVETPVGALAGTAVPVTDASFEDAEPMPGGSAELQVDRAALVAPALVRATLLGDTPEGEFAIVMNGVVAATALSYEVDGMTRVAAMVDPARFEVGANPVALYRITG
jgi:hypothetical protein